MLVLERKLYESIQIGDAITITVVGFKEGKVRLGLEAPKDVPIVRTELLSTGGSAERSTKDA